MIEKTRDLTIDILKGIGIISVVVGHSIVQEISENVFLNQIYNFIYIYHIAVFFYIAGYSFKFQFQYSFWQYLWRKINSLYFPFLLVGLSFLLIDILRGYSLQQLISESISFIRFWPGNSYSGAMWFLPCLFITEILFYVIEKTIFKFPDFIQIGIYIFFSLLGFLFVKCNFIFYNIDLVFLLLPVMKIGLYVSNNNIHLIIKSINIRLISVLVFLLSALIFLINFFTQQKIDFVNRQLYGLIGLYPMISLGLILCVLSAVLIEKNTYLGKVLSVCGKSSFYIMCYHIFVFKLIDLLYFKIYAKLIYDVKTLYQSPYSYSELRFIYIFLGTVIPVVLSVIIKNIKKKIRKN